VLLVNSHPKVTGTSPTTRKQEEGRRIINDGQPTHLSGKPIPIQAFLSITGSEWVLTIVEPIMETESADGAVRRKLAYMDEYLNIFLQTAKLAAAYGRPEDYYSFKTAPKLTRNMSLISHLRTMLRRK
jgi:hypothetical protein